ncbi:tRNA pseudouridine(55) synthase TruB [Corallococcus exiguus]|uniref:tRNA pseudouridine synthase B n=1 Tax=Corallococcus exiguus TaxID=83462 RepID=A0A7X4YA61_9BACT|nr:MULTISPECIES: tRNA pseudouridine(55) synthase TruB [Corallococcus]NBC40512.1 tRNA pseudouridine(55) synthase TruB [Corallococcus exiguus]NNC21482.1 tRNA pseudouridine(55) synthase TruB [Corallococcus exiguus]NRD56495.1 tRNA pseudouridine(55) synthase TruB [Corallococcus exiguus]NRD66447.1 tRNA pseudouridine(55) synthase TruB [Corallococcus exiguus]RKH28577.1 tRNA pseudouridine(55) synthase TruB [Corallococcus sp. CA041A]
MDGVLVIDKPLGPTSFDVVRQVRGLLKVKKAGHTGTLDPMATGVLPVCLGEATKVAGIITEGDKAYDAVVRLGVETDTQDAQGKPTAEAPVPPLTAPLLEAALARFRGTFDQVPPMYSAVKVAGKRLYELARAGEEVERASRSVTVHELVLRDFSADRLTLSVRCTKGFYVRTLAYDLGRALGCGAHLEALRRTMSGPFTLARALPLGDLASLSREAVAGRLVSLADALTDLPAVRVTADEARRVLHGVPVEVAPVPGRVRVLGPDDALLAMAEVVGGRLRYQRVFN